MLSNHAVLVSCKFPQARQQFACLGIRGGNTSVPYHRGATRAKEWGSGKLVAVGPIVRYVQEFREPKALARSVGA
jgi:hypothetical protein